MYVSTLNRLDPLSSAPSTSNDLWLGNWLHADPAIWVRVATCALDQSPLLSVPMNNGNAETATPPRNARAATNTDELHALTNDLMKAEVRLAKARATVATAEIDIKVLNSRLKTLMK